MFVKVCLSQIILLNHLFIIIILTMWFSAWSVLQLSVSFPESFQFQNVPIMHFLAQLILQEELKEYQIFLSKLSPLKSIQKINLVKLLVFYYVIEANFLLIKTMQQQTVYTSIIICNYFIALEGFKIPLFRLLILTNHQVCVCVKCLLPVTIFNRVSFIFIICL